MRFGNSVLSWTVSLISGSIISAMMLYGNPLMIFWILVVTMLLSLPYLILFAILSSIYRRIWFIQVLHFILVLLTMLGCFYLRYLDTNHWYVPGVFYVVGAISHALFFYKDPLDGNSGHSEDVLDDML